MLRRAKSPRLHKQKEHSQLKSVVLFGSDEAITAVAEKRKEQSNCYQYPNGATFPEKVRVRVVYEISNDGFITIRRVLIQREQNTPVCFFDRATGQVGEKALWGRHTQLQTFIYLTENRLAEIIETVGRIEDAAATPRLTRLGPQVFRRRVTE